MSLKIKVDKLKELDTSNLKKLSDAELWGFARQYAGVEWMEALERCLDEWLARRLIKATLNNVIPFRR